MSVESAGRRGVFTAVVLAAALTASCAGFSAYKYRQFYSMVSPVKNSDGHYEDGGLSFQFEVLEKKIRVLISNSGDAPVEVEWPDAKFIDQDGAKHEVANLQTLLTKNQSKIRPTNIPAGGTEENVIVPADRQEPLEQWTWYIRPFFNQVDDGALNNLGKTIGVLLPVKVGGEERRYSFEFKVTSVIPYQGRTPG